MQDFDEVINHASDLFSWASYLGRNKVWLAKRQFEKAISDCDRAVSIAQSPAAYAERSTAFRAAGNLDRASADLDKSVELQGNISGFAHFLRGLILSDKAQPSAAISEFTEALRVADEPYAELLTARGLAFERTGDIQRAITDFRASEKARQVTYESKAAASLAKTRLAALPSERPGQPAPIANNAIM
jgi:tetratricopeptide (TPR) repeat protein